MDEIGRIVFNVDLLDFYDRNCVDLMKTRSDVTWEMS